MKNIILSLAVLLACAGCAVNHAAQPEPAPASTTTPVAAEPPTPPVDTVQVVIGHVAPLTGSIWNLGQDNELGARLAIEELNARGVMIGERRAKFVLVSRDDAGDPRRAVTVAQELVDLHVNGVIGHLNSGTSIPASAIYQQAGIPQISPSATNPAYTLRGYRTSFRLIADDRQLGHTMGRYSVEQLKAQRFAVVDDRTAYGEGLADEFADGVKAAGGRVVIRVPTHNRETDFGLIVARLKQHRPDIVFYGGMDFQAGLLLREMASAGMQARLLGGDGICTLDLLKIAGPSVPQNAIVCGEAGMLPGRTPRSQAFKTKYRMRFGQDVLVYAPFVYDAVMVMAEAMAKAGSADPKHYLPVLAATRDYNGVTDSISFAPDGNLESGWVMLYTYRDGRREVLDMIRASAPWGQRSPG
ncbi:MAG: branched-chain amino acid ABC transporter substrate-binding protein [Rhizobacter sp.]